MKKQAIFQLLHDNNLPGVFYWMLKEISRLKAYRLQEYFLSCRMLPFAGRYRKSLGGLAWHDEKNENMLIETHSAMLVKNMIV
jgi:hypothetical protein